MQTVLLLMALDGSLCCVGVDTGDAAAVGVGCAAVIGPAASINMNECPRRGDDGTKTGFQDSHQG